MILFLLVFINSIMSHAQFSSNVLRGIDPSKGVEYNTNLVLQNGFKLKQPSNRYKIYLKNSESIEITQDEIQYRIYVENNQVENYINKLNISYAPKNCRSKVYNKTSEMNTMRTYLINDNLMLIISGSSSSNNTKGYVRYEMSIVK